MGDLQSGGFSGWVRRKFIGRNYIIPIIHFVVYLRILHAIWILHVCIIPSEQIPFFSISSVRSAQHKAPITWQNSERADGGRILLYTPFYIYPSNLNLRKFVEFRYNFIDEVGVFPILSDDYKPQITLTPFTHWACWKLSITCP